MAKSENTLLIKNLPERLTNKDQVELLRHFGATHVRCMPVTGKMRHCAFATFSTKQEATLALSRLHQLEVLGHRLCVVFSTSSHESQGFLPHLSEPNRSIVANGKSGKSGEGQEELLSKAEEFQKWLIGILPDLGVGYPRCPLLHYKYPPPTQSIISNIANTLIAVPKFYTQVLHLMNAMNLPVPFGALTPAPPLSYDQTEEKLEEEEMEFSSTEESEMESDTENKSSLEPVKKSSKVKKRKRVLKRPRLFAVSQPVVSSTPAVDPSLVFDTTDVDTSAKKISFNIKPADEAHGISDEPQVEVGGFGMLERPLLPSMIDSNDPNKESEVKWKEARFITRHELDKNRISSREMKGMSVYKNYQTGEPTCRLYVKNLAKQVNEMDLFSIYGRFVNQHSEQERNMFDVRLMKEGRMKGQAFVTLASQNKAQEALRDTNGYLLHGKPIVVQYARSAKPKDQELRK